MYDRGKILAGIGLFLALALFPVWRSLLARPPALPEPKLPAREQACVAPKGTMRAAHMEILNAWRTAVVRSGVRMTRTADGREVRMSLTGTCMRCHADRKQFCDTCHNALAVSPVCWNCHVEPKERS